MLIALSYNKACLLLESNQYYHCYKKVTKYLEGTPVASQDLREEGTCSIYRALVNYTTSLSPHPCLPTYFFRNKNRFLEINDLKSISQELKPVKIHNIKLRHFKEFKQKSTRHHAVLEQPTNASTVCSFIA